MIFNYIYGQKNESIYYDLKEFLIQKFNKNNFWIVWYCNEFQKKVCFVGNRIKFTFYGNNKVITNCITVNFSTISRMSDYG